jgi:hypothetical protein
MKRMKPQRFPSGRSCRQKTGQGGQGQVHKGANFSRLVSKFLDLRHSAGLDDPGASNGGGCTCDSINNVRRLRVQVLVAGSQIQPGALFNELICSECQTLCRHMRCHYAVTSLRQFWARVHMRLDVPRPDRMLQQPQQTSLGRAGNCRGMTVSPAHLLSSGMDALTRQIGDAAATRLTFSTTWLARRLITSCCCIGSCARRSGGALGCSWTISPPQDFDLSAFALAERRSPGVQPLQQSLARSGWRSCWSFSAIPRGSTGACTISCGSWTTRRPSSRAQSRG